MARAAKSLRGSHRLLLSGTPVQNDALELWSLFDFLMPGYLGQRRHFHSQYVKPISASYGASAGDAAHTRRGGQASGQPSGDLRSPSGSVAVGARRR